MLDALGEVERHQLAAEAGDGPELRHLGPLAARQTGLLCELAPGSDEGLLTGPVERACRELDEVLPGRLAQLAHEGDLPLRVDGDDHDRAGMLDDLALVVAPLLERDGEELALPGGAGRIGLHARSCLAATPAA